MRAIPPLLVVVLVAAFGGGAGDSRAPPPEPAARPRVAALKDSLPGLFLEAVNRLIRGNISPRRVQYRSPATLILEDTYITDPAGGPVAHVKRAELDVAVTPLLVGDVVVKRLELEEPRLLLELAQGKLNLLEAFSLKDPKQPKKDDKGSKLDVRIEDIRVRKGGFRYRDGENITVSLDDIVAAARVEVDLESGLVTVNAKDLSAAKGNVRLPELDVPLKAVRVGDVKLVGAQLTLEDARGQAAGAMVTARGTLRVEGAGKLNLTGRVDAPAGAWPERLAKPPFALPKLASAVRIEGPFADPRISLDGSFEAFTAFGYAVRGGTARAEVTKDRVRITEAKARLAAGQLSAAGRLTFSDLGLDLDARLDGIPLEVALAPAKLEPSPEGALSGVLKISGVADGKAPIQVGGRVQASGARGFGVTLPSPATVDVALSATPALVQLQSASLVASGLEASARGQIHLDKETLALDVTARADRPLRLVSGTPGELAIQEGRFAGRVKGPYARVVVEGDVSARDLNAYGVPGQALSGRLLAGAERVVLSQLTGQVSGGAVSGEVRVALKKKDYPLSGTVKLTGADLTRLRLPSGEALPLSGRADVEATLGGTTRAPAIGVGANATGLVAQGEPLGRAEASLRVTKDALVAERASLEGEIASAHTTRPLRFSFADQRMDGHLAVEVKDLAKIRAAEEAKLEGQARGVVELAGTVPAPRATAWLDVQGLSVLEEPLGRGPLVLKLVEDPASTGQAPRRLVQASGRLRGGRGSLELRASYALERERVNGELDFVDVNVGHFAERVPGLAPLSGVASGRLSVRGPLEELDADLHLEIPEVAIELPAAEVEAARSEVLTLREEKEQVQTSKSRGPVELRARLVGGALEASLCAFEEMGVGVGAATSEAQGSPCAAPRAVWLRAQGSVSQQAESLDLVVSGRVAHEALEELAQPLRAQRLRVALVTEGSTRVQLTKGAKTPTVSGDLRVLEVRLALPDAPAAQLVRPARLSFASDRLTLQDEVRFDVEGSGVTLKGSASPERLDLSVEGRVALALAKIYLAEISNAAGTVEAQLSLTGTPEAPLLRGFVVPNEGASVTSRSLRERVELTGGRLEVAPLGEGGARHAAHARDLSLRVGDGTAVLDGALDVDTSKLLSDGQLSPTRWDLVARGSGITVTNGRTWVESSFNVGVVGDGAHPRVTGQLEVNDGLLRERFEMQNFVLTTRPGRPSEPFSKLVKDALRVEEVALDLDVVVHNFRVRADIVSFPLDAQLAGNLRLEDTLRVPNLVGAIEVMEGSVSFPRARLEVTEARVEFPRERAGLQPKIFVTASGELPAQGTGCSAEVPVKLTLEGEDLERIQMDLTAEEAGQSHTRTHLLAAILLGRTLPECTDDGALGDPNAALRAVSSGLTAGFTREIEDFVARELGSEVQVNLFLEEGRVGGGLRWRLSKRLELEGETGFSYGERNPADEGVKRPIGSNARARLLLLDHLPLSGDLFLEGGFATPEGTLFDSDTAVELKLKYRVFEN